MRAFTGFQFKNLLLSALLSLPALPLAAGITAAPDSISRKVMNGKTYTVYAAANGETLQKLAENYQLPVSAIEAANPGIKNQLRVGQLIYIPYQPKAPKPETAPAAVAATTPADTARIAPRKHVVQRGDTYYSLSRMYQVPVDSLRKWNGPQLIPGRTLVVQGAAATPKAPANKAVVQQLHTPAPVAAPAEAPQIADGEVVVSTAIDQKERQRVLIIPFDPYLYFSDADDEIARVSKIPRQNVRQVFRNRLVAFLDPKDYETINLLGGVYRDSVGEINRIYRSLSYNYQDILYSKYNSERLAKEEQDRDDAKAWLKRQKEKLGISSATHEKSSVAKDESKYYGVKVKNPDFYSYFNKQYAIDYYLFINQFEVSTNYENCLDRAALNYEREFLVHYSIFNNKGEQIAGNKVKVPYHSNCNDIQKIVSDNMEKMAKKILADLPPSQQVHDPNTAVR